MNELALFAGAGGGILGGLLLGWRTVCAVEIEPYCIAVLINRQNEGVLPAFPIWDDVRTFDGKPWRGIVDVVSGGFPCQDISVAGNGAGITGERSGLWKEMLRIIREVRPRFAFVENVPALISRGLSTVLGDLAEIGYDAEWCVLGADDVGANHRRKRIWILAYSERDELRDESGRGGRKNGESEAVARDNGENGDVTDSECLNDDGSGHGASEIRRERFETSQIFGGVSYASVERERGLHLRSRRSLETETDPHGVCEDVSDSAFAGFEELQGSEKAAAFTGNGTARRSSWWLTEPDVGRVADGVAARVDRLRAIGNGQVPLVAATAWRILIARIGQENGE